MTPADEIREQLAEANPDALFADGLDAALIGYTINTCHAHVAVYSAQKCVNVLVDRDGMTPEEAGNYLEFNTYCVFLGRNEPLFVGGGQ
jgi:hypothetical protein